MDSVLKVGSVVYSKNGRDSGSYYAVVEIVSDIYVKIADGSKRLLEKPKLKKIRHLKPNGEVLSNIAIKLLENKVVYDKELKSALRPFNDKAKTVEV